MIMAIAAMHVLQTNTWMLCKMLQGFGTNTGIDEVDADWRDFLGVKAYMLTAAACETRQLWGMHFNPIKVA